MKKTFLLAMTVFAAFTLKAGNLSYGGGSDKKLTIGVSVGVGIPMGAYGISDTLAANDSTHRNGWAKTGFHFDVTAGYLFTGNIGGMIYIGGNMNSFNVSTYESIHKIQSPETVTATSYYAGQYLVGPFLSLPAGDKLKVDIRLLVGLVMINTSTVTESSGGSANVSSTFSGNGGSGFGWQVGAGLKYGLNDNIGLTFNLGYTGASITYTGYTFSFTNPAQSKTITNTTLKQTMSTGILSATVGIAFNL